MSAVTKVSSTPSLKDPSTYLQRPTSAKTPDVSHILTSIFGEKFTKDILSADVIKNLTISSDVDDEYHKRYVSKLKEAQLIKENRIQEYAMLEKHILEARAKALAYEDREEDKRNKTCEDPDKFGVPPTKSYFSYCLDDSLLKDHGLLVPSDYYYKAKRPFVPMPKDENSQSYLAETLSSKYRSKQKMILPPINSSRTPCIDDIGDFHKSGSELSYDFQEMASDEEETLDEESLKPFWKDNLRQEERLIDKELIKKLENRTRFLPNPRLDAARTAQSNANIELVFVVNPKTILFNKYIIGKVYESTFEVRNTSMVAHQFRALPPKTQYFSLSLGQYPQSQSVIAPGLSALFNVRFAPDSLCTYQDEILVECSNGSKMIVPILAKRESPCLSIGSFINCGHCLVGQIKGCRFVIQNNGGDGRFVVFPKSSWPASTFKTNVLSTTLNLYPFEIQPSIFELRKGDIFVLEVIFKPPDAKKYEQDIVIACDNCTTLEFKLIGEGKLAEIEYIESGDDSQSLQNLIATDDYKDKLSNKIIRFPTLNPNVITRKRFSIRNNSSCPIDYSWAIYKPVFEDNLLDESGSKNLNYVLDKETLFSIAPKQGTLDRDESKTFEIIFSPTKIGLFNSVAHMILHGIPEINKQMMLDTNDLIHKSSLSKDDLNTSDFVATVIELRGECEPFQFTLDPPAIFVPGAIYMQSTTRKAFRLINMSICPINFNWKQILEPHIIQVEPAYGEIAPKSYALMDVLITGVQPGKVIDDIPCYVEFADEPIYLHVEAEIKGPEIEVKEAGMDFGLVQIGDTAKSFVTIENISSLPLKYRLSCAESYKDLFKFKPGGSLQPLESKKLSISFAPQDEIILNTQFEIQVENGNKVTFNCHGQAQKPNASFLQSEITIDELYLNSEKIFSVKLCNHSVLEAKFAWGKIAEKDSSFCDVKIEPSIGSIKSKSILECLIQIKVSRLGELKNLRIPCFIEDMSEPIYLSLKGLVKGVSADVYSTDSDDFSSPVYLSPNSGLIKFEDTKVGQKSVKYIFIKNTSGITTNVDIEVKNFKAIEINEKEKLYADPTRPPTKLTEKFKLKENLQGLGFGLDRTHFELPEFGLVSFALVAVAEVWGSYYDDITIKISGIDDPIVIPIEIDIIDSPIKLYTGKVIENESEEISMLRFGSQTQGKDPIVRKLQIQNTSWIPIQIDWKIFLLNDNDKQLIDVNLIYHDGFSQYQQQNDLTPFSTNRDFQSRNSSAMFLRNQIEPISDKNIIRDSVTTDYYENGYIYIERIPFVKIALTGHYGDEVTDENRIFYLNETKLDLKPREKSSIQITFNTNSKICKAYEAIFVGYLSLPSEFVEGPGFKRRIGFEKDPVRFKATGTLESPNLTVEYDNDDLNFVAAIGDLINKDLSLEKEKILTNQFSLLNTSLAPIEFDLNINKPFYFSNFNNSSKRYSLKPKSKLKVDVIFKFDSEFINSLDFSYTNQAIIQDLISVNFSKDLHQAIPIGVKVHAPELTVTKNCINFGTTLIEQERHQQFFIRNHSYSSVLWIISIENDPDNVFRCDVEKGILEADKVFINKNEQLINVFYKAKQNITYNAKLVISVQPALGIKPNVIELKGAGSFDQKLDAILDA